MSGEKKLCYVSNGTAYFTAKPLSEQWGDDWDDAPYECNAGEPYKDADSEIEIVKFDSWLCEACEGHYNSPWSVQDINGGACAWLWDRYGDSGIAIQAGCSIDEFKRLIWSSGGEIYLRAEKCKKREGIE